MNAAGWSWIGWTIAVPTLGATVCGLLLQFVAPNARGSGVPQVKTAFALPGRTLRLRDSVAKFFISTLQIGSGSSLGREGPTVQICAGISSTLGRLAGVSAASRRRLIPVGAAAGIAAAFNAPIAAVTFTIEEVVGNLDQTVLSGVIVAAALAAVIERSVLGEHPVFSIPGDYGLHNASSLLIYALIGVAAAAVSLVFTDSLLSLRKRFAAMTSVPLWARPAVGGLVTGSLAALVLWSLGAHGVTGGGYDTLGQALGGKLQLRVMMLLCAVKMIATVFSYASGGAGGIFAPVMFIGGMLGGALGTLDHTLLQHPGSSIGAFALVGMGATFSGVIRAPMTGVLIIVEMTGGYSLVLPLMIANMSAYALVRRFRPVPIYEALLEQDGIKLPSVVESDVLEHTNLGSVINTSAKLLSFSATSSAADVARQTKEAHRAQDIYPVLDINGCLLGIITRDEMRYLNSEPDLQLIANAVDLMRPPISLSPGDNLRLALETMVAHGFRELPVTDTEGHLIGYIEQAVIAQAYLTRRSKVGVE
jgi:CIC family chloride channel protein